MSELPDDAELERLGLYDPAAANADDVLAVLRQVFALGPSIEEVQAAAPYQFGDLALDLSMRPPGETVDLDDFAATSGHDPALVRRMWAALGLPASGPVRVTPDAAEALRVFLGMSVWTNPDTAFTLARVVATSSARLAEALISAFRVDVEMPQRSLGARWERVVEGTIVAGRELLPPFLEAANAVFRRHMVAISYQMWSTDPDRSAVTLDRCVGFADLVSSTEATRAASVASLAKMVRGFEELVWDMVASAGGRVVKLIGDEAMFVIEDPAAACDVATRLIDASPQPVRVGLAHGTVVALYGDYYGETVNLAARLVDAAEPSTIAASDSVKRGAGTEFTFDALPERELKGFGEPVTFYRASRR